jgi:hypothetical protein
LIDAGSRFGFSRKMQKPFALNTCRYGVRLIAQTPSVLLKTFSERINLFETTPLLHGAAPVFE